MFGRDDQQPLIALVHRYPVCNCTAVNTLLPYLSAPMQVHRGIENLPGFSNTVLTIGTFDGVHCGHQKIIDALQQAAAVRSAESIIVTFDPHPRKIVRPSESLFLINTLEEKIALLSKTGIDHLVIVPFTKEFAEQPADDYIKRFLVENFKPASIVIGYDHHFGRNRSGNYHLLEEKAADFGFEVIEIPKHLVDEVDVSSTKIRNAIFESRVENANKLLGYPFFFTGDVVHGDQLGRELGFPTANIQLTDPDKIHLGHGVYAVKVKVNGLEKKGMMSIGNRPTLKNSDERVEVNLFDFDEEIYGSQLTVEVHHFLRAQEKYDSLEAMVKQLHLDKENALSRL